MFSVFQNARDTAVGQGQVEWSGACLQSYSEAFDFLKGKDKEHKMGFEECKTGKICYPLPKGFY